MVTLTPWEAAARLFERPTPKWETPGKMAMELDNSTVQTEALDVIDAALVKLANTPDGRLIISMPPQEGKSQRVTRRFVMWTLQRNPNARVAIASYEQNVARRWGRTIRDDIEQHGGQLGMAIRSDVSAQAEWQLLGGEGGVYSVGVGGALTGRSADLLVIDDPIKDRTQADSLAYRDKVWDWWTDVGSTRLSPGAPVVLVLTRWHEDDLAARLLAGEDGHLWEVVNIPAQAEDKADPLGRRIGEFLRSSRRRTVQQWEAIKVRVGPRTWASLYQGRPAPLEGDILKRSFWRNRYTEPVWVVRDDGSHWVPDCEQMIQSWDLAFKGEDDSDFVVGQVWMRQGANAILLDQVRGQMDFPETCQRLEELSAKWPQALLKLVEDKANGPAVIAQLGRTVPGIVPEEPQGGKVARANAISPLGEAGNIVLPDPKLAPWVGGLIVEASAFPNGANDDQVDALTQGVNRLILQPLLEGGDVYDMGDMEPDLETYSISLF